MERDRESKREDSEKKKNKGKFVAFIVVIAVVLSAGYFSISGFLTKSGDSDGFAKCLTEENVKMYGAFWCPHCQNQKELFGSSFQYVDYVECDPSGAEARPELCKEKKIQGYPTWEIKGNLYPGELSLEKLSELAGCNL